MHADHMNFAMHLNIVCDFSLFHFICGHNDGLISLVGGGTQ